MGCCLGKPLQGGGASKPPPSLSCHSSSSSVPSFPSSTPAPPRPPLLPVVNPEQAHRHQAFPSSSSSSLFLSSATKPEHQDAPPAMEKKGKGDPVTSPFLPLKALGRSYGEEEERKAERGGAGSSSSPAKKESFIFIPSQSLPSGSRLLSSKPREEAQVQAQTQTQAQAQTQTQALAQAQAQAQAQARARTPSPMRRTPSLRKGGDEETAGSVPAKRTPTPPPPSGRSSSPHRDGKNLPIRKRKEELPMSPSSNSNLKHPQKSHSASSPAGSRRNSFDQESFKASSGSTSRRRECSPTLRRPTSSTSTSNSASVSASASASVSASSLAPITRNSRKNSDHQCSHNNDLSRHNGGPLENAVPHIASPKRVVPANKISEATTQEKKQQNRIALKELPTNCVSARDNVRGRSIPTNNKGERAGGKLDSSHHFKSAKGGNDGKPSEDELKLVPENSHVALEKEKEKEEDDEDEEVIEVCHNRPLSSSGELRKSRSRRRSRERFLFPDVQTLLMADNSGMSFEGLEGKLTVPASVSKACSILEAVADLHMTSSIYSETEDMDNDNDADPHPPSLSRFHFKGASSPSANSHNHNHNHNHNHHHHQLQLKEVAMDAFVKAERRQMPIIAPDKLHSGEKDKGKLSKIDSSVVVEKKRRE